MERSKGGAAKAPSPAPTTYQVKPDVCGQDLVFLVLILLNGHAAKWGMKNIE